jgi:hypothetical protein
MIAATGEDDLADEDVYDSDAHRHEESSVIFFAATDVLLDN